MAKPQAPGRAWINSESGFSLAEILVTVAIVGITFAAILGGMLVSVTVSSQHRKHATADAVARSAAEWVKDGAANGNPYKPCASPTGMNSYSLSGLPVPSGFSVTITKVEWWNGGAVTVGSSYSPAFVSPPSSCPSPDKGLQRITIVASSSDGQATETVQILKRVLS